MPKLKAEPNVSETYQVGWDPVSYEQYLKTPEGKAELTAIHQKIAEQVYVEQEAIKEFLRWFQLQMAPNEKLDEETSDLTQESSESFWKEEKQTKRSDQNSDKNEDSKTLDNLIKEQEESYRKAVALDRHLQSNVASHDQHTKQNSSANEQELEEVYSRKRRDTYSITSYEYHLAKRRFRSAEVSQAEKLAALQQREGVAWLCEYDAEIIRQRIPPIKDRLRTLSQNSPERRQLENLIDQAESLAKIKEDKALEIREEIAIERAKVNQTLQTMRRDETRWDMSAAQSGMDVDSEDHAAQVERRNQMLHAIQNRSALRSPEEREAARRAVLRNEVQTGSAAPAPSARTPGARLVSTPSSPPPSLQSVRQRQQRQQDDPYGARNLDSMTREQALNVLGISQEQWNSLPPDTLPSERKDTGEIQDKADLLVESQISKSQLYTDYKIPGNREKQGQIQAAYNVLDKEISEESAAVHATQAQSSSSVPQQAAAPAVSPETTSTVPPPVVESSIPKPIMSVDVPPKAQLSPPSAPAWQRRMDDAERSAMAATIDQNSQAQSRFYSGNLAQQRAVVDEQYQQAIQERERAAADLARVTENPTKSSALANQQDREYLASRKKEADDRLKHYETLANYYGVESQPYSPAQLPPQPAEAPEAVMEDQKENPAPVEPANQLSREDMRQARLKRMAQSEAAPPPIDPAKTSLSVKSSDVLNTESPEQREQRFANLVQGEESVVVPHTENDGYYVQIGQNNVLDVTEEPMKGTLSADLAYNKNELSPDTVADVMTAACVSAGVGANSVAQVSGEASEEVQQALINEDLFANVQNVTTESPSKSEESSSMSPFKQQPTYSSGYDDDDDDESNYSTPNSSSSSSSSSSSGS